MYNTPSYKMHGNILREIMGGEPVEIAAKIVVGALAMLWNDIQAIGWGATAYFILLFVDAVFGAVIAQRKGKGFNVGFFILGPGKKVIFTALMLFSTAIVDRMVGVNNTLVYGVVAFVCMAGLIDVARKYGDLTGSRVVNFIEDKASQFVTIKPKDEQ